MPTIRIHLANPDESIAALLNSTAQFTLQIAGVQTGDNVLLDAKSVAFCRPFYMLPVAAYCAKLSITLGVETTLENVQSSVQSYMQYASFPDGILLSRDQDVYSKYKLYQDKSYIPITRLPNTGNDAATKLVLDVLTSILKTRLQTVSLMNDALQYLISEAITNIEQHSLASNAWIQGQVYSSRRYMDVAIVDTGIGILGGYKRHGFDEVLDDTMALEHALQGRSTKLQDSGRGYGLRSSRNMLCDGMGGRYVIWSGNALAYRYQKKDYIIQAMCSFPGTVVLLRIPYPPESFDYRNYLE